ncbi:MAG TPA: hypothetical protein PLW14_03065 [Chlorobiota bacterium]|nr:hypothetical protein [Chlorobiota bacterium]
MPRRTRDGLLWGIGKVAEETSIARAHVEWLMRHGHIRSVVYRGELVTREQNVLSFLDKMFQNPYPITIDGVSVFTPLNTTQPVHLKPLNHATKVPSTPDRIHQQLLADIESIKNGSNGSNSVPFASRPTRRKLKSIKP